MHNGVYFWLFHAAEDNLRFIVNWLKEFPQYKDSEFFLAGDSYAGGLLFKLTNFYSSDITWCTCSIKKTFRFSIDLFQAIMFRS